MAVLKWMLKLALFSAASAADSGAVGGHLPHDLLHDPDESAGGAVLFRGSDKLGHEAGRRRRSPENADYRICGFRPALHSDSCYRKISFFAEELRDFLQS